MENIVKFPKAQKSKPSKPAFTSATKTDESKPFYELAIEKLNEEKPKGGFMWFRGGDGSGKEDQLFVRGISLMHLGLAVMNIMSISPEAGFIVRRAVEFKTDEELMG